MIQPHATYEGVQKGFKRVFWEMKVGNVNRTRGFDCRTVASSWSMHSVQVISASNNAMLEVRDFSCFCHHCI
jgi:hypothetical protein